MKIQLLAGLTGMQLILSLFSLVTPKIPAIKPKLICNGNEKLCSRRYNQIAQIEVHNATSNRFCPVQNQDRTLQQQLYQDGLRAFKIPIHYDYLNPFDYYAQKKDPSLDKRYIFCCHALPKRELYADYTNELIKQAPSFTRSFFEKILSPFKNVTPKIAQKLFGETGEAGGIIPYTPCLLDTGKIRLKDVLITLRIFLENNPHEVITLLLNDFIYNRNAIIKVIQESDIASYMHAQDKNELWPTLEEMIKSGKRLVVFTDTYYNAPAPSVLNETPFFSPLETRSDFASVDDLIKKDYTPMDILGRPTVPTMPGTIDNKIIRITHEVTPKIAGSVDAAKIVNAFEPALKRLTYATKILNHTINFTSIDFYEYPSKEIFAVIDRLNERGAFDKNESLPIPS